MLNGWNSIENQYFHTFQNNLTLPNFKRDFRKLCLIYLIFPFCCVTIMGAKPFFESVFFDSENSKGIMVVRYLTMSTMTVGTFAIQLLFYIICYTMSRVHEEIRKQLKNQYKKEIDSDNTLSSNTISKWKSILMLMGNQLQLIGDWLSPAEMLISVQRVILVSTSFYTLLAYLHYPARNAERLTENHNTTSTDNSPLFIDLENPGVMFVIAVMTIIFQFHLLIVGVYYAEKIYACVSSFAIS